ncbi:hypothetical protein GIB67_031787 [Kingdonia uniflora]|uniref:Uncharacterized protein n=1 Tax=Kingdonia uniflora TaxID=39325 RepID=A0A7J7L4M4_9MAGN|nr:hypothetical protein GIB67_031787 [Kingdonia uniflora]
MGTKRSASLESKNKASPSSRSSSCRNPLRDLNTIIEDPLSHSIEARREGGGGCLSFLLSNPSSKNPINQRPKLFPKTPKSAPSPKLSNPKPKHKPKQSECSSFRNSERDKKKIQCLNQVKNGKDSIFRAPTLEEKSLSKLGSGFCLEDDLRDRKQQQWRFSRSVGHDDDADDDKGETPELRLFSFEKISLNENKENGTPVVSKMNFWSDLDENSILISKTKTTPPVEASISPEIPSGSLFGSATTTTTTCFGAGHLLSGVTDKRKCRPRGILTVGEKLGFSEVPAPTDASIKWLLSPCGEEEENQKSSPQIGLLEFRSLEGPTTPTPFHSPSSPSSVHGDTSDSFSKASSRRKSCLISPSDCNEFVGRTPSPSKGRAYDDHLVSCSSSPSSCKGVNQKQERGGCRYELTKENSSLSEDSLGSQNMICTPQSNSSSTSLVGLSWLKNVEDCEEHGFELDSKGKALPLASSSPVNSTSTRNPADVLPLPGFSFQFTRPVSSLGPIDQTCSRKKLSDPSLGISSSSFASLSSSEMKISWREGLISRIFDMDELDCCRCLSDEEEDVKFFGRELDCNVQNDLSLAAYLASPEFQSEEPKIDKKGKRILSPQRPSASCAESISTDGGGLFITSGDSDWTAYYKNNLFEV